MGPSERERERERERESSILAPKSNGWNGGLSILALKRNGAINSCARQSTSTHESKLEGKDSRVYHRVFFPSFFFRLERMRVQYCKLEGKDSRIYHGVLDLREPLERERASEKARQTLCVRACVRERERERELCVYSMRVCNLSERRAAELCDRLLWERELECSARECSSCPTLLCPRVGGDHAKAVFQRARTHTYTHT